MENEKIVTIVVKQSSKGSIGASLSKLYIIYLNIIFKIHMV